MGGCRSGAFQGEAVMLLEVSYDVLRAFGRDNEVVNAHSLPHIDRQCAFSTD